MYVQIAIAQIPLFTKQQIAEETLQIDRSIVNPLCRIPVVGSDQRITEIPRVTCKLNFDVHL
jgi:hypothetical protein